MEGDARVGKYVCSGATKSESVEMARDVDEINGIDILHWTIVGIAIGTDSWIRAASLILSMLSNRRLFCRVGGRDEVPKDFLGGTESV